MPKIHSYDRHEISISQDLLTATLIQTLGEEDFKGLYIMWDLGLAEQSIATVTSDESDKNNSTTRLTQASGRGIGGKVTAGYGYMCGEDTRFLLAIGWAIAKTKIGTGSILDLSAGFNF